MSAYLLTWNPATTPWPDLEYESELTASGSTLQVRWSCGVNKSIIQGDRVFLLKQGKKLLRGERQPRGLMAAGWVTSKKVEIRKHWDEAKARQGKKALYIHAEFERVLDPEKEPLLPVADTEDGPISEKVYCNTPASGVSIPDSVLDEVEERWREHLERNGLDPNVADHSSLSAWREHFERIGLVPNSGKTGDDTEDWDSDLEDEFEDESVEGEEEEPEGSSLPERVLRAILDRRGQQVFRQKLLRAYGGRCCITGCDAEPGLEAAHIQEYADSGSQNIRNGLLLRADLHTLFDLGLIRINPETMRVVLDRSLKSTSYGELHGTRIRTPNGKSFSPVAALRRRWRNK